MGPVYERAVRGRGIWKEICEATGTWYDPVGSLQLAYDPIEASVLREFHEQERHLRPLRLLDARAVSDLSGAVRTEGLLLALHNAEDLLIDPRQAIPNLTSWLVEKLGVKKRFGRSVTAVSDNGVTLNDGTTMMADHVFICPGSDLRTLFPNHYGEDITLCKLQMMRLAAQPDGWRIGPALCGGLSLIHYASFAGTPSMDALKKYYFEKYPEYLNWGIHVMVSQNGRGEVAVGDSHEYGPDPSPFNSERIDKLILDYLSGFARFRDETIIERWHGIYSKMTNGEGSTYKTVLPGVHILNGLGGAGMTLSFGLAEEICAKL
jgi:FAD dependent oxidoreductase TIGR03364